jgi:hypothetical protein
MPLPNPPSQQFENLKGDAKVLAIADQRLRFCIQGLDRIHREALEDLMFYDGQQWPEDILRQRNDDRRPSETINKIPPYVHQVVNDMRQNRPQTKIRPVDNVTDPDTASVIDGLIRSILNNGNSKNAVDTATFYQVCSGFGYIRVLTQYADEDSFDQEITVERIENPFSVYVPIDLINELDFSDMPYCFIRTRISKDDYAEKYPDEDMSSYDTAGVGEDYWIGGDFLYICEYFEKVCEYETLYLLSDGRVTKDADEVKAAKDKGITVENEREVEDVKIVWRKITRHSVLEEKEFPGHYIPVIPFLGQEINVNGEKKWLGLVRYAKAPQRMYNYSFNAWIEVMALAPRAPFVAAQAQIEGYEDYWKTANSKNYAYLPYHPVTEAGSLLPPPQRTQPPEGGQGLFRGIELAAEQLKEVTGIFDASLGSKGNEISGKAILARQRQGDVSNFHFTDNQAAAIHQMARIMIDIIPEIYDMPRAIRILGEDMTDKIVEINKIHADKDEPQSLYDMSVGKYDVVIDIGPNFETKRVETAEALMNIMRSNPQAAAPIMDLLYRNLDFTYANEAADRMKAMIQNQFPGIIQDDKNSGGKPTEQQVQAMVADMQKLMQAHQMTMQENQQMQQMIQGLQQALKSKADELQVKADGQVLRTQAEAHKANTALQQTVVQAQSDLYKHAVDTGLSIAQQQQQQAAPALQPYEQRQFASQPNGAGL